MPTAPETRSSAVDDLRRLRLGGEVGRALQLAGQVLQANPRDWAAMGEAVRILICLGEAESAASLYEKFSVGPHLNQNLEPEALVRLALLLDRRDLLTEMEPPQGPSWLVTLLKSGTDPADLLLVADLQLRIEIGHPVFAISGACPYCGQAQTQEFRNTLLVRRGWICPSCFGLVSLDHTTARDLLQNKYSHQLAAGLQAVDHEIIEQIKPRLMGQVPAPFIVRALGQNYQFVLNELALRFAEPDSDSERPEAP